MNKTSIFEITSHSIAVMVGYLLEGKPIILFNYIEEYNSLTKDGKFINEDFVANELRRIYKLANEQCNGINSKNIYVVFPNETLKSYQESSVTNVVSNDSKVIEIDIRNIYSMARNRNVSPNVAIIDVVADQFIDDKENILKTIELGYLTKTIRMDYHYYTVMSSTLDAYQKIMNKADIYVKKYVVSSIALATYFAKSASFPSRYIMIQSYQNMTNLSYVANGDIIYSSSMKTSLDDLFNQIATTYDIDIQYARSLVYKYGIDLRKYNFEVSLYSKENKDGKVTKLLQKDLNKMIASFLTNLVSMFSSETTKILQLVSDPVADLIQYVIIGDVLKISGFKDGLDPAFKKQILFYSSNNPCALSQDYASMLATLANSEEYNKLVEIETKNVNLIKNITRGE